jgi:cytochrome c-type biogenesis protein CcmH/NrfG
MRSAADLEDSIDKQPVTPGSILPMRELLGDLLIELNQPKQALDAYETSLRDSPNRFNGLYGAARAAALSGDKKKARALYAKLLAVCDHADGDRPEILEASAFLANN